MEKFNRNIYVMARLKQSNCNSRHPTSYPVTGYATVKTQPNPTIWLKPLISRRKDKEQYKWWLENSVLETCRVEKGKGYILKWRWDTKNWSIVMVEIPYQNVYAERYLTGLNFWNAA